MGRDVTGLLMATKPSAVKANGGLIPNGNPGVSEGTEKKFSTPASKSTGAENIQEHLASPKTVPFVSVGNNSMKLSTPALKSADAENTREHLTSPKTGANGTENVDSEHLASPKTAANGTENVDYTPFPAKDFESNSPKTPLTPRKHPDEEDDGSVASPTAGSGRTPRLGVTIGTAPTFRSAERAEKRREFYQKLEEKHQALEAERSQAEARIKEEQEAALKQLRKNLVVKAKPVPSFYYKEPPPKAELKKLPLTRPKSPNLTRKKICGDAVHLSQDEKANSCCRTHRNSLGTHRERSGPANEVKSKGQASGESGNGGGKLKDGAKQVNDATKSSPTKLAEQSNANITVQS